MCGCGDVKPVGSTVTISGFNASMNGEVRIYVVGMIFLATTMANSTGGYSINITAPAIPIGTYSVMAVDVETSDTASSTFDIEPRILLTPEVGSYNNRVSVAVMDSNLIVT